VIAWAEGDKQADLIGHGGEQRALMVYQIETYRYWQDFLGRDDFTMGQFGEISGSPRRRTTRSAWATGTGSVALSSR
jgi:hypothetical protein